MEYEHPRLEESSDLHLIPENTIIEIHKLMVKSRILEERLIKIYRKGDSYFWIGGTGEEAFGVSLGLLVHKGEGPDYDYLHLHYRSSSTLMAMGLSMTDAIRLMMNRSTDPSSGGRNFSNHYCFPKMNVVPITSPIEVQYLIALGTARVQKRKNTQGITIVTGGDAGTAEGDFASSLIWSTRPNNELPVLITVQNNRWGISTNYASQHGEQYIADRGKAFGIRTLVINGNDPITSYLALKREIENVRKTRKPTLMEFMVSRLNGHSSASGANRVNNEIDGLQEFEKHLIKIGLLNEKSITEVWNQYEDEAIRVTEEVRLEPTPSKESIWDNVYHNNENADWRKF